MPQRNMKIFVLDDDPGFLRAVLRLLRVGGYDAQGFATMTELFDVLPVEGEACILSDIMLKNESGFDLPRQLTRRAIQIPIVFLSATDDPDTLKTANELGASPCLRKPVEATELFEALQGLTTPPPTLHLTKNGDQT